MIKLVHFSFAANQSSGLPNRIQGFNSLSRLLTEHRSNKFRVEPLSHSGSDVNHLSLITRQTAQSLQDYVPNLVRYPYLTMSQAPFVVFMN